MAVLLKAVLKHAAPLDDRELDNLEAAAAVVLTLVIVHVTRLLTPVNEDFAALFQLLQHVHSWLGLHSACHQKSALLPRLILRLLDEHTMDGADVKVEREQCVCCVHKVSLPSVVDEQVQRRRELEPHGNSFTEPWKSAEIAALCQLVHVPLDEDPVQQAEALYQLLRPVAYQILTARTKVPGRVATSVFGAIEKCQPHLTARLLRMSMFDTCHSLTRPQPPSTLRPSSGTWQARPRTRSRPCSV
jgi:hypothetical protein